MIPTMVSKCQDNKTENMDTSVNHQIIDVLFLFKIYFCLNVKTINTVQFINNK